MSLIEIIAAAAKRFDARPIYRASIEARREIATTLPTERGGEDPT